MQRAYDRVLSRESHFGRLDSLVLASRWPNWQNGLPGFMHITSPWRMRSTMEHKIMMENYSTRSHWLSVSPNSPWLIWISTISISLNNGSVTRSGLKNLIRLPLYTCHFLSPIRARMHEISPNLCRMTQTPRYEIKRMEQMTFRLAEGQQHRDPPGLA